MDRKLLALTRTWCLFEVWSFVYYDDVRRVRICMPENLTVGELQRYETLCRQLDLNRTETGRTEDKAKLLSEVTMRDAAWQN